MREEEDENDVVVEMAPQKALDDEMPSCSKILHPTSLHKGTSNHHYPKLQPHGSVRIKV